MPVRGGRDHSDIPDESAVYGIQNGTVGAGADSKIIGACYDFHKWFFKVAQWLPAAQSGQGNF